MNKYQSIISHYEACLEKHGDSYLGVDWPKIEDVGIHYQVMLAVIRQDQDKKIQMLDFGCGCAHLYDYILKKNLHNFIDYSGLEISEKFVTLAKYKFPHLDFYHLDVLEGRLNPSAFDYVLMNGVFTESCDLHYEDLIDYFREVIKQVFDITKKYFHST